MTKKKKICIIAIIAIFVVAATVTAVFFMNAECVTKTRTVSVMETNEATVADSKDSVRNKTDDPECEAASTESRYNIRNNSDESGYEAALKIVLGALEKSPNPSAYKNNRNAFTKELKEVRVRNLEKLKVFFDSLKTDYIKKLNFEQDISKLSMKDLLLLRSSIYAVNGLYFKDENLNSFFLNKRNTIVPWYSDYMCFLLEYGYEKEGKKFSTYNTGAFEEQVHIVGILAEKENDIRLSDAEDLFVKKIDEQVGKLQEKCMYTSKSNYTVGNTHYIVNLHKVKNLDKIYMDKLAQNNFVIIPTDFSQLYNIYEQNNYDKMPSFVTTDLFLQAFHVYISSAFEKLKLKNTDSTDNEILQSLVDITINVERAFPKGLDVFSAFGSAPASDLLTNFYKEKWSKYPEEMAKLQKKFSDFKEWDKSIYNKWIESLLELQKENKDYPAFMQTRAWDYKNLNTSLALWAELKHTFNIKAINIGAAEGGYLGPELYHLPKADVEVGYVEPNLQFWKKLDELVKLTEKTLSNNNLFKGDLKEKHGKMQNFITFLIAVSEKELAKQPLSSEEYERIRNIGAEIEHFTIEIINSSTYDWGYIYMEKTHDRSVAVVADVYTRKIQNDTKNGVLHAAKGNANEIYVVVEINGYLYLTKGATFSYYEFIMPEKIKDEEWQKKLAGKSQPAIPEWMQSIVVDNGSKPEALGSIHPIYCFERGCEYSEEECY